MAAGQLNTFLDELYAHIPVDKREAARSAYSKIQDRATTLETATERVNSTATQQQQWWEKNKDAVAERDRLAAENTTLRAGEGTRVDQNAITEAMNKVRQEALETGLGIATTLTTIASKHTAEFGEPLDATALAEAAIKANQPLQQFYDASMATRREERRQAGITAQVDAARKEGAEAGRQEVMASMGKALPYPHMGQPPVTTLSGLKKADAGAANPFSLEAAVATANEVLAGQNK